MSISRNLTLAVKLGGYVTVKDQLASLQKDLNKIQNTCKFNISFGGEGFKGSNGFENFIDEKIKKPMNAALGKAKSFGPQLYREFANNVPFKQDKTFFDLGNYVQNNNKLKFTTYADTVDKAKVEAERQAVLLKQKQLEQGKQMSDQFRKMKQERIDQIDKIYKAEEEKINYIQKRASQLFKTGFGLHIVQIYIAPVLYALEQVTAKMITTFAEFDKKFTDYKVKSEEYGEYLSQEDFYKSSIGKTYGIQDAAIAAERFAASGVDVAKSQQALTSVMQVATVAHMDYADAANGVIKTMQAMHMEVQDTTIITDALINSANASTAELSDLVQWFEYAASSAYQAGLDVKQLSAYLGILASTGTPNTGAAMRQLFLQLSKEDIQKELTGKFSWIKPEDFTQMDQLILKMREYVRSQTDQKAATLEITRLLGGKANAQQALNNLIMAEPGLWNQVNSAVNTTGSTQDLYNKVTNNSADAIQKIKINLEILFAQLGEFVGPVLKVVATIFTAFTNFVVSLPSFVKGILGIFIVLGTVFTAITFTAMGVVGALAIMKGTLLTLNITSLRTVFLSGAWKAELKLLTTQIFGTSIANTTFTTSLKGVNLQMLMAVKTAKQYSSIQNIMAGAMIAGVGAMAGYAIASSAMQNQMYMEAEAVSLLTSAWIAFGVARMGAFNPLAIGAGIVAGASYEALMYSKIENMKRDAKLSALSAQTGVGGSNKNYQVHIENANINGDGMDLDDLIDSTTVSDW